MTPGLGNTYGFFDLWAFPADQANGTDMSVNSAEAARTVAHATMLSASWRAKATS